MRKMTLNGCLSAMFATATMWGLAANSNAASIYGGDTAGGSVAFAFTGNGAATVGYGDDYNTGAASAILTGLTFKGGLNAATTVDQLVIDFYSTAGVRVASIFPSESEVLGNSTHTLAAGDFSQNGVTGIPIPGAGYIIFSPYAYNGTDNAPQFTLDAGGAAPTVGSNDASNAAKTTADPTTGLSDLSVGRYYFGFGNVNQYADFSLSGTAVPEPVTLGLVAPASLLIRRRRRSFN